jgi:hypothetical protein
MILVGKGLHLAVLMMVLLLKVVLLLLLLLYATGMLLVAIGDGWLRDVVVGARVVVGTTIACVDASWRAADCVRAQMIATSGLVTRGTAT